MMDGKHFYCHFEKYKRGEEMNKKSVAVLLVAFLLAGGVVTLFADESVHTENTEYELAEPQSTGSPVNPCGGSEGNGGGIPG
jgi:hypothetical protein